MRILDLLIVNLAMDRSKKLTGILETLDEQGSDGIMMSEEQQRQSLVGRMTDKFRAAFDSRRRTQPSPTSTATTIPDGSRSSIPAPPPNDPFYKKIMSGALAIVLERPEITEKIWGVRGKENQYNFFRTVYDPSSRQTVLRRLLNGFKGLFCGETTLGAQDWIKVLNVANQLSTDKVVPASLMTKLIKLYQYQVQGKKTQDNVAAIQDFCLNEEDESKLGLGSLLW